MHRHIKHQAVSFRQAVHGILWAFYTQPHFQFHIVVGTLIVLFASVLRVSVIEFVILVFVIFSVIVVELLNTAVEAVVNLVTDEWEGYAKVAKDVSAGAVLLMSLGAAVIGCLIFLPKIMQMFSLV